MQGLSTAKKFVKIKWVQICMCMYLCIYRGMNKRSAFLLVLADHNHSCIHYSLDDLLCVPEAAAEGTKINTASCRIKDAPSLDLVINQMAIIWNITVWNERVMVWNAWRSSKITFKALSQCLAYRKYYINSFSYNNFHSC